MCRWVQKIYCYTCGCNWSPKWQLDSCDKHAEYLSALDEYRKKDAKTCGREPLDACKAKWHVESVYEGVDSVCDNFEACPGRSR